MNFSHQLFESATYLSHQLTWTHSALLGLVILFNLFQHTTRPNGNTQIHSIGFSVPIKDLLLQFCKKLSTSCFVGSQKSNFCVRRVVRMQEIPAINHHCPAVVSLSVVTSVSLPWGDHRGPGPGHLITHVRTIAWIHLQCHPMCHSYKYPPLICFGHFHTLHLNCFKVLKEAVSKYFIWWYVTSGIFIGALRSHILIYNWCNEVVIWPRPGPW